MRIQKPMFSEFLNAPHMPGVNVALVAPKLLKKTRQLIHLKKGGNNLKFSDLHLRSLDVNPGHSQCFSPQTQP